MAVTRAIDLSRDRQVISLHSGINRMVTNALRRTAIRTRSPKTRQGMIEVLGLGFEELFEIETSMSRAADIDFAGPFPIASRGEPGCFVRCAHQLSSDQ